MKAIIMPCIPDMNKTTLDEFISTVESSFLEVNTEHKLEYVLKKMKLMSDFKNCDVSPDPNDDDDSEIDVDEGHASSEYEGDESEVVDGAQKQDDSSDSSDDDDNDYNDVHMISNVQKPMTTVLMPIAFQLKAFLELPNVFHQILKNTEDIRSQNKLNHFITGNLWKEKLKNYGDDEIVIPYNFYVDGAQLNNSLGPHTAKGLENFNYITLPTIPAEYQSRLENIFVASLFHGKSILLSKQIELFCYNHFRNKSK